jgi:uncharacterized protein (TIRG00374 family)
MSSGSTLSSRLMQVIRVAVTVGALAWMLTHVSLDDLSSASRQLRPTTLLWAFALSALSYVVATARWWVLLTGYGASPLPPFRRLLRWTWVGAFFNTFLPGNIGGDVVRAHRLRSSFASALSSYVVILVDRGFGVAGLFTLGAITSQFVPIRSVRYLPLLALMLVAAAYAAGYGGWFTRLLRKWLTWLPARLHDLCEAFPSVRRHAALHLAFGLALLTQFLAAFMGYLLMHDIQPEVGLLVCLTLIPLALIAAYVPVAVAGIGVREAAFVVLFGEVGVSRADATVASLCMLVLQLMTALVGGAMHVLSRADAD